MVKLSIPVASFPAASNKVPTRLPVLYARTVTKRAFGKKINRSALPDVPAPILGEIKGSKVFQESLLVL